MLSLYHCLMVASLVGAWKQSVMDVSSHPLADLRVEFLNLRVTATANAEGCAYVWPSYTMVPLRVSVALMLRMVPTEKVRSPGGIRFAEIRCWRVMPASAAELGRTCL
jgi:hypothetical protein